ncbi:MAG: tocopherol cyclase family protein [Angelakisella sp.]
MNNFHGETKRRSYFEGWYLKHQSAQRTVAVIPAFHLDKKGKPSASIQVITNQGSHWVDYPVEAFKVHPERFVVRVGSSSFSHRGVRLNIVGEGITVTGQVAYGPLTPPSTNMMGPFRFLPAMQCNHGVLSLTHTLTGALTVNGEVIDFTGGVGYIEKDWGSSFPSTYLWTQCSWEDRGGCSIMVSIADIPFFGGSFTGCIAAIYYGGVEYRLATYNGVKICRISPTEAVLMQGELQLHLKLLEQSPHKLKAPRNGDMSRTIHESASCRASYRFTIAGRVLFDFVSENAGFEQDDGTST